MIYVRGDHSLERCVRTDRHATVVQLSREMNQGTPRLVSITSIQRTLYILEFKVDAWYCIDGSEIASTKTVSISAAIPKLNCYWLGKDCRLQRVTCTTTSNGWVRSRVRRETSDNKHPTTIAGRKQYRDDSVMVWIMYSSHYLSSCTCGMCTQQIGLCNMYLLFSIMYIVQLYKLTVFLQRDRIFL